MANIRIILFSNSQIFIRGISSFLDHESGFVTQFVLPEDLKDKNFIKQFDLAIIDGSLEEENIVVFFEKIKANNPNIKGLLVSSKKNPGFIKKYMAMSISGFISPDKSITEFTHSIRSVLDNKIYLDEDSKDLLIQFGGRSLSKTESAIVKMLGSGEGTNQIASKLDISTKTVAVHRANIKKKLKISTHGDLIKYCYDAD